MSNIVKDLYFSVSFNFLATFIGYGTFIYLGYLASEKEFGLYLYLLAVAGLVNTFINFASDKTFSRFASKHDSAQVALNTTLGLKIILLSLFVIIYLLSIFVGFSFNWYLIAFLFTNLFIYGIYEYKENIRRLSFLILQERIFFLILCLILTNLFDFVFSVASAYVISSIYFLLRQYFDNSDEIRGFRFQDISIYVAYMKLYFPVFLLTFSQLTYGYTSRLILENRYGLEIFASISIAYQFINIFGVFQGRVDTFFRPRIIKDVKKNRSILPSLKLYFYSALLPVILGSTIMFSASEILIELIFSGKYSTAGIYLSAISPLAVSISLYRLQDIIFLAYSKNLLNLLIQVSFSAVVVIVFLMNIQEFNPEDYISAMVMIQFTQVFISFLVLQNIRKKNDIY